MSYFPTLYLENCYFFAIFKVRLAKLENNCATKLFVIMIFLKLQCWKIAHASVYLVSHLCSKSQSSKSKIEKMFGNGGSKIDKNSF